MIPNHSISRVNFIYQWLKVRHNEPKVTHHSTMVNMPARRAPLTKRAITPTCSLFHWSILLYYFILKTLIKPLYHPFMLQIF